MSGITVPVTDAVYRYLGKKQLDNAYRLACLGETSTTWDALGHACIEQGELNLAKKCFSRIRDVKYLNLLSNYEVNSLDFLLIIEFILSSRKRPNVAKRK
jgi:intraflagellar transport protein 122